MKKVKIINPTENGSNFTSRKQAIRYVAAGRAVFVDANSIRFVDNDPRNEAANQRAAAAYNSISRLMTKKELANIPFVRPGKALVEALTKRSGLRFGRSGNVRIITGIPSTEL